MTIHDYDPRFDRHEEERRDAIITAHMESHSTDEERDSNE